jgi:hypothetical protein
VNKKFLIIAGICFIVVLSIELPLKSQSKTINYDNIFPGEINVCNLFPKEKIEEISGKKFVSIRPGKNKTLKYTEYFCEYRQETLPYSVEHGTPPQPPKHIVISFVRGDIKGLREAYRLTNDEAKQDKSIPFPHQLIYNRQGKLLRLEIFLAENLELIINTWWSFLNSEESLQFFKKFALYFKEFVRSKSQGKNQSAYDNRTGTETVPLPRDEDVIRIFVELVKEDPARAALMMKTESDNERQNWTVQFASIKSIKLLKMEKANENFWTDNKHIYKVTLHVLMEIRSADAPIPYYGWENGVNVRWITLEKIGKIWKIAEIATGP